MRKHLLDFPDVVETELRLNGYPLAPPLPRKWRRIWQELVAIFDQEGPFRVQYYNERFVGYGLAYFIEEGTAIVFLVEEASAARPRRIVLLACGTTDKEFPRAVVIENARRRLARMRGD